MLVLNLDVLDPSSVQAAAEKTQHTLINNTGYLEHSYPAHGIWEPRRGNEHNGEFEVDGRAWVEPRVKRVPNFEFRNT